MPRLMPRLGLGTASAGASAAGVGEAVAEALARGFTHVDCAPLYGNQAEIGARAFASLSSEARAAVWITSKLWLTNFAGERVRPACEHTLAELQLGYLDLYLMHAQAGLAHTGIPPAESTPKDADGNAIPSGVPNAETWRALEQLHTAGLCRNIGVSNFTLADLDALLGQQGISVRPICNQIELHPWNQQPTIVAGCLARGVRPVAFSPLGKAQVLADPTLGAIARSRGTTVAQVCLQWNLQRGVTVIPHTVHEDEMAQNLALLPREDWAAPTASLVNPRPGGPLAMRPLSEAEMQTIATLDQGRRFLLLDWGVTSPGALLAQSSSSPHTPKL